MTYEFVYLHIVYACGHEAIRPVLRNQAGESRQRWSYDRCQHCDQQLQSRRDLRHYAEQEQESAVSA